ncbi:MAG: hypothetical protein IJJ28_04275, partial [Lentisphaeria bacterium]|nr:hypothetical protein [Lentisphaeria bacterium]
MSRTFWIGVGAAVVLVAAMGVGFFINPLIAMAAVPVGGAAAGWLAGRNGTFRGFGGGLLALFGLALVFAVCVLSDPRAVLEAVASDEQRMLVSQFVDSIPPSFAAVAIGLTTIIALELFLCVFNSAILFKRWYFVAAAAVILWAEAAYLGMWLFYAFGAVFAAVTESSLFFGLTALFVLLPVLLTVWAVWNLRAAKQRNWRNFAWCAGGFAVGTFFVWGVAALSIFLYSGSLVERTAKSADPRQPLPRELVERERELRAATIRDFTALHERGIALPYSGMLRWRGAKGKTATAEAKRKTIDFAASEEGKAFFARNRELIDLYRRIAAEGEFVPEISLAHRQGYRAAV